MEHNLMWIVASRHMHAATLSEQAAKPFKASATECSTRLWQRLCNKLATDFLTMLQQAGSNLVASGQKPCNKPAQIFPTGCGKHADGNLAKRLLQTFLPSCGKQAAPL